MKRLLCLVSMVCLGCLPRAAPSLVGSNADGFAVYRSGRVGAGQLEALCRAGVREMVVLDGTALERECKMREKVCPELRVRLNVSQRAEEALSEEFLAAFDRWIEQARHGGHGVAFRCQSGWHRSGRLAAYYQMKYQGWSVDQAREQMNDVGRFMWRYDELQPQAQALWDHIHGLPCSVPEEHCVKKAGEPVELKDICGPR